MWRRLVRKNVVVIAAVAVLAVGGCGDDGDEADAGIEDSPAGAQPAPDVTTFAGGGFDELPRLPRSEEVGTRTDAEEATVQSYTVRGITPEGVLEYYAVALADAEVVEEPHELGEAWRGAWLVDGRQLLVSATDAPTVEEQPMSSADVHTQYSLTYYTEGNEPDDGGEP